MTGTSRITVLSLVFAAVTSVSAAVTYWASAEGIDAISRVVSVAPPNSLAASAATSSAVTLAWSGDAGAKVAVERKILGAAWLVPTAAAPATAEMPSPSTIAVVTASTVTDSKIDAFTTYVYRIRAVGANNALTAPSNELIVGPPPVGFSTVIATPRGMQEHDPAQFASQMRMAFDNNGDPTMAYITNDLNNDGELEDTDLSVITWNRARYRWNAPVELDTVGNVARSGTRQPFSFTRDASNGTLGVLHLVGEHELRLTTSADGGVTWKHTRIDHTANEEPGFSTPSFAMAAGRVYVAYAIGSNNVTYKTGLLTDAPTKWTAAKAPVPEGSEARLECIKVALDAASKPVVAYCTVDGYNTTASLWRPDVNKTVKITDTNGKQNDDPGLDMTISGSAIAIAMYAARDEQFFANHHLWFARSTDNGATWAPAVVVADDGGNAMDAPVTITLDRAGHSAMVANMGGGNDGAAKCGLPKLMRSVDGVKWTTCAPETKGAPANTDVVYPVGAFAGNDKLYVAFKGRQSAPGMPAGLTLWRER
ncbi:MAG: sialidase family protein [Gemmatimonas sp.]